MKSKTLKMLAMVLTFVFALTIVGCNGGQQTQKEPANGGEKTAVKTIKFTHWFNEDHPQHKSIQKFKELVEEKSNGTLKVEIYPNSQLGSEETYIDSIKQGTVQMGCTGTMIAKYMKRIYAAETPFLFNDWEDARAILNEDSDARKILLDGFTEASGMRVVAITVNGFRQFSSNKDLSSIEAFKGQRIRVPNVPNYIKMIEALGASPIALSLTEVFTAMEQKAVDGQDNPYPTVVTSSFYEVQKNMLESYHMFSPNFWIVNDNFYNSLTDNEKKAFDESIVEASNYNWDISEKFNEEAKQTLLDKGMKIIVPDDKFKQQLRDAEAPVYDWYCSEFDCREFFNAVWKYQGKK